MVFCEQLTKAKPNNGSNNTAPPNLDHRSYACRTKTWNLILTCEHTVDITSRSQQPKHDPLLKVHGEFCNKGTFKKRGPMDTKELQTPTRPRHCRQLENISLQLLAYLTSEAWVEASLLSILNVLPYGCTSPFIYMLPWYVNIYTYLQCHADMCIYICIYIYAYIDTLCIKLNIRLYICTYTHRYIPRLSLSRQAGLPAAPRWGTAHRGG